MDLYGASQMKQQSAGRHVVPLAYIIFIPSTQVFDLTPLSCVLSGQGANTNVIGFDLTRPGPEPERCIWKHYLYLFLLHSNLFFNQELFPFERGTMLVQVYFFNIEKDNYCIGLLTTPCWTYNSCVFVPLKFVILPTAVSSNFVSVNCRVLVKIEIFIDIWIRDFDTWKWLLMLFMFYVAHKISWCEWKLKKNTKISGQQMKNEFTMGKQIYWNIIFYYLSNTTFIEIRTLNEHFWWVSCQCTPSISKHFINIYLC